LAISTVASGVFGIGTGAGIAAMSNVVVASVPSHQVGAASGMNANLRTIGGALGTAAITAIAIGNPLHDGPPGDGYTLGFAVLAVLCVAAAASATLIPRSSRR
jgi:hypothetical protein